jgi:hypothetical protein
MYQPCRSPLRTHRARPDRPDRIMPPEPAHDPMAGTRPYPQPGHTRWAVPRWRTITACTACGLAGLTAGAGLHRTPPAVPTTHPTTAAASASRPTARPHAAPTLASTVYRLLPVTASQLSAAVTLAVRFTAAYGTYSYTQAPADWLARLRPDTAPALQAALVSAATDPSLIQLRARQKATATCSPTSGTIRDIASTAITVMITARQRTSTTSGITTASTDYAVTVAPYGATWKVYDIQPATAGQSGETFP